MTKILKADFGQFTFLDDHTVVATANDGVNIDGEKVQYAINLIEQRLPGDYAIILERKSDYSVVPVEVYTIFSNLERLKALAIVRYSTHEFLPDNMEQRISRKKIEKFTSISDAHDWINSIFDQ